RAQDPKALQTGRLRPRGPPAKAALVVEKRPGLVAASNAYQTQLSRRVRQGADRRCGGPVRGAGASDSVRAQLMPRASDVTSRDAVLAAIAEFDQIGREAFLHKYGFRPSRE